MGGAGVSEGHYVVAEPPGGRPVLLLGPYASASGAASQVARAQRGHRRARPSARGWQYGTVRATAEPGRPLPQGSLNGMLGLWPVAAVEEEPEPVPEPEAGRKRGPGPVRDVQVLEGQPYRSAVPFVRARFRLRWLKGWDGEPMLCEVTRVGLGTVWFRPVRADGSLGDCMRAEWGGQSREFASMIGEWDEHPTLRWRANAPG